MSGWQRKGLTHVEQTDSHKMQAWDMVCRQPTRLSLNNLLAHHKLPSNVVRNPDVYKKNERFWAVRPLTEGKTRTVFWWTAVLPTVGLFLFNGFPSRPFSFRVFLPAYSDTPRWGAWGAWVASLTSLPALNLRCPRFWLWDSGSALWGESIVC